MDEGELQQAGGLQVVPGGWSVFPLELLETILNFVPFVLPLLLVAELREMELHSHSNRVGKRRRKIPPESIQRLARRFVRLVSPEISAGAPLPRLLSRPLGSVR